MTQQLLTLTDNAAEHIKSLMAQAPEAEKVQGFRIGVKSGGCSGMSYFMEYATEQQPMEEVVEQKGVKIFVHPQALMYLIGTEMDYQEGQFESGFVFNNPNEAGRCGCGKSFKV
jgi:iron-sulfur cluster assembly protein